MYNDLGHVVRKINLGSRPSGSYGARGRAAYWDGRNALGEDAASGVYFVELRAGDIRDTRRILLGK